MSDNATLLVTAVPNAEESDAMQEYLQGVMPLLVGAGGELVKRLQVADVINGDPTGMALVMDFPSTDVITELFESDAYASLVPARDRGFKEMNILIANSL
jgi:uncharacterized protein (DUF1330 family)